ncbi:hypothetical protein ACOMHN_065199 [Nucella lapillus]
MTTGVISVPPVVVTELSSDRVVLKEGETATLVCNVTGVPPPDVTWYKRNSRQIDGKKERVGEEGSILVISNVTRACDDIYECYVDNGVPPAVTKAIRVIVEYPPEVHLPTKRIGQSLDKETILDCVISAKPQAVTEWRRNGKAVRKSDKHDIYVFGEDLRDAVTLSLRVKKLDKSDYGRYVCVGSNHLGHDHKEMVLYEVFTTTTTTTTTTTSPTTPPSTTTNPTFSVVPTPPRNRQGLEYPYGPNGQALADGHVFHSSSPHHGREKTKEDAILEDPRSSISTAHGRHLCFYAALHVIIASLITSLITSPNDRLFKSYHIVANGPNHALKAPVLVRS